ncbi:Oidioi.mRNA.OKI2018_I69.PAR.g10153.t1.cds [Oikopleura dioica]|uniref:Oidioi.mRNA.OKI2018_I69.PAR.g10153.t1.cds n=1 Tax=Oikopleura dioica TaxID=34765 RepID=A0ABN7RWX4_OIKDI|nr:Oidioi.mRNA.OKI2018_I69.PAR.g10153.t1.cds [Oikopleura dioica]
MGTINEINALRIQFHEDSKWVEENIPNLRPKDLEEFYGLYKQATENGKFEQEKKPSMLDWHEKAKYKSWKKVKDYTTKQAMESYTEKVDFIKQNKLNDFKPTKKEKEAMLKCDANNHCVNPKLLENVSKELE